MTIEIGQKLPDAELRAVTADGPAKMTTAEIFAGKKIVLFAVPGAFTPTCSVNHLPGYLELNDEIRAKGVDTIAVVSVNDAHVMSAWEKATGATGQILFLADGNAAFTRAVGLDQDLSAVGFGARSKRYAMIVEDGTVTRLGVEDGPGEPTRSSAKAILADL